MKKAAYIIEFAILLVFLLPFSLNNAGNNGIFTSITLPNFQQVKSFVLSIPEGVNSGETDVDKNKPECLVNSGNPIGFPFVYKTDNNCKFGQNYNFGLFLNYVTVIAFALIIIKLTSMAVNQLTKKK